MNNWVLAMCQILPGRLSTLRWKTNQSLMPGSQSQNWMFHRTTAYPTERRWGWREIIEVRETQLTWGSWTVTPLGCEGKTNICNYSIGKYIPPNNFTYFVTLNILKSLKALRTERPKDPAFGLKWVQITSNTLPLITIQSNLWKWESYIISQYMF